MSALLLMHGVSNAQYEPPDAAANPPVGQPLVREGDLAFRLVEALGLGTPADETEAESILSTAGISPLNGWLADYPVTPDIVGELQASIGEAADSGTLSLGKDTALTALQDVINGYGLSLRSADEQDGATGSVYPDPALMDQYYSTQGPPVVTYYSPPPSYAYMYTWVPYPFLSQDFWFPGFFILVDFDIRVRHEHFRGREHERRHDAFITNHFRDRKTERMRRIDPTTRAHGWRTGETGGTRGFNHPRLPSGGTRSGAFDRFGTNRFEGSAGDRGFHSRSGAGLVGRPPARSKTPGLRMPGAVERPGPSIVEKPGPSIVEKPGPSIVEKPGPGIVERPRQEGPRREERPERQERQREDGFRDRRGGTFHGGWKR